MFLSLRRREKVGRRRQIFQMGRRNRKKVILWHKLYVSLIRNHVLLAKAMNEWPLKEENRKYKEWERKETL